MKRLTLTLSLIFSLFLFSCSSDEDPDRWLTFSLPWAKISTSTEKDSYIRSYDIAIGDTSTIWMAVVVQPTNINIAIPELYLYTSKKDIIKNTPIWKNSDGNVYHSLITANEIGTTFLYLQYKDLKDSIEINVIPK